MRFRGRAAWAAAVLAGCALVGRMRAKLPKDATVFVMSDHGFHSFRRCVKLNCWLAEKGSFL
jgi:predicted AlkP superfamily phosphohydrolase/phosphomutase